MSMLEVLEKELKNFKTYEEKFNHLRELLQILILKIFQQAGFFKNLAFVGGTALRLLFDLRRFSEDLDFSLIRKKGYNLKNIVNILKRRLNEYNLSPEIKVKSGKAICVLEVKFKKLLFDLKLSNLPEQKVFIKIEIDTNPPSGYNTEVSLINKLFVFDVVHFDLPSLYATKIHACFFRKYVKGRDFYDLMWYLTKKVTPNYKLLNNAIAQTHEKRNISISSENFKEFLKSRLLKIDFAKVKKDVERFLENKEELELFRKEIFLNLVEKL